MYHYEIEIRDKDGKPYLNSSGHKVINSFRFTDGEKDANLVHLICTGVAKDYEAIVKKDSQITITVSYHNKSSNTYPVLFTYYGKEKRFINH